MHQRIAARALCRSPAMAMAIVALAAIQTGKLCLLATFPANSVSIVRRFYTSGTLPNERRANHKRSSFLCNQSVLCCFFGKILRQATFPSSARRGGAQRRGGQFGEIEGMPD